MDVFSRIIRNYDASNLHGTFYHWDYDSLRFDWGQLGIELPDSIFSSRLRIMRQIRAIAVNRKPRISPRDAQYHDLPASDSCHDVDGYDVAIY